MNTQAQFAYRYTNVAKKHRSLVNIYYLTIYEDCVASIVMLVCQRVSIPNCPGGCWAGVQTESGVDSNRFLDLAVDTAALWKSWMRNKHRNIVFLCLFSCWYNMYFSRHYLVYNRWFICRSYIWVLEFPIEVALSWWSMVSLCQFS